MTKPGGSSDMVEARERRATAELQLAIRLQSLVAHELGNPLQSLVVLVELTRDELAARDPADRGIARLDRVLESVDRFRDVMINAGRVRRLAFEIDADARTQMTWGAVLDELIEAVAHRLARVEFERATAAIDALPLAREQSLAAVLAALVGVGEQLRRLPPEGVSFELRADVVDDRVALRFALSRAGDPVELDAFITEWIVDLLAESPTCSAKVCAGALILSSPLA